MATHFHCQFRLLKKSNLIQHKCSKPLILDVIDFHGFWTNNGLHVINPESEGTSISAADEQGIIPNNVRKDE